MVDSQTTVIVAENSETQSELCRSLLEKAGYHVLMVSNGSEALGMIRTNAPDIVITGFNLPEMTGIELLEAIHADFPCIPVILAPCVGSEEIAADAMLKGAASYVPPQSLKNLIPIMKRVLAGSYADRASAQLSAYAIRSEVQFMLPNEGSLVAPLVAQIKSLVERFNLRDSSGAMRVAMAVDEALQNAILHGNLEVSSLLREGEDTHAYYKLASERRLQSPFKNRQVYLHAVASRDVVEITIRDEGPGFDPTKIPNPTDPAYLDRPCGRGLWLIHAFIDEVRHNATGNEITMILRKQSETA
ncbi:MAG: response regulator [Planctomycetota bacterium]|nr:MAG: response regulator [Planctomycetota bacterium]